MKFYIVDAFSDQPFGGNTAGVVLLESEEDFPEDEVMTKTAAELRYSETAFIKPKGNGEFRIRYFTPVAEVDVCGHATIGSFGALLEEKAIERSGTYKLHTLAGELEVSLKDGFILMDMSSPQELAEISDLSMIDELAQVMGIQVQDIGLTPQIISTGLPDLILHVKSKQILMDIKPDFPKLAELSKAHKAVGVHAFCMAEDTQEITAFCRNFAPLYDIDEEAATGTSNGALTYYLYKNGIVEEGKSNIFIQGESMNRPSKIMSLIKKEDEKVKIKIGGSYAVLAKGEIFL